MSPSYVRLTNRCGRKITLHPHFQRPMKGPSHPPRPIVLAPNEVSQVVLQNRIVGCAEWGQVKDCIQINSVNNVPEFAQITTPSRKTIEIAVKTRTNKKGKRKRHKIEIKSTSKPRAIRVDILADPAEIKRLRRRKLLKIVRVTPTYPPRSGSFGYDDELNFCYECGRPIVFRGSPPIPIHV